MTEVTIWHNPRCTKSRETLALLQDKGARITERRYLEDAPTEAEIRDALALLGLPAIGLMRVKEKEFRDQGLSKDSDEATLIAAMAATPKLIERPVVFANGKAALGRPPEAVLEIL
ncbi:arsenate reductase (glutaredoxin) [Pseudoruegeria sp. HB172150]|uniref:arsenate reductase (glutaredoxin) n=1 Tax=Pseudoruegeria sp. HB172150 TaxID=2721164 RepID=UPI001556D384|nr:arsenate reductase (glutaredoxin) [Pseudoruegeria sp. HB172150]